VKLLISQPGWPKAFGKHLWAHFLEDRCFEAAGSLSYKTLIALVPLLAVMIGIVSSVGLFDDWIVRVESYVFTHFVPAKGNEIQAYINQFIDRTAGLTASGSALLIVISVLLMGTIERTFNRIWRVRKPRSWINRVVIYWAALTLGPLLLGASLALSSYLALLPSLAPDVLVHAMEKMFVALMPFLIAWVGFGLVFMIVPHRRVYLRHAAIGALVSALLFEAAKAIFVFYLGYSTTYQHLYGALATIPIFLLWIYVLWITVLLGASLSAALTTFHVGQLDWRWSKRNEFVLLLRLLHHLWMAQNEEKSLSINQLRRKEPGATDHQIQSLLEQLNNHHFIEYGEDGMIVLAVDLSERTLADVYQTGDFVLPIEGFDQGSTPDSLNVRIMAALQPLTKDSSPLSWSVKKAVIGCS